MAVWSNAGEYLQRLTGSVGPLLLLSLAGLSACQSSSLFNLSDPLPGNTDFANAWETYRHCNGSSEPEEIRADLHELVRFALAVNAQNQPPVHLPAVIRPWMEALPSRLAVDPNAMAVACAQRGARMAALAGRPASRGDGFTPAGTAQEGSSYVWYAIEPDRGSKRRP